MIHVQQLKVSTWRDDWRLERGNASSCGACINEYFNERSGRKFLIEIHLQISLKALGNTLIWDRRCKHLNRFSSLTVREVYNEWFRFNCRCQFGHVLMSLSRLGILNLPVFHPELHHCKKNNWASWFIRSAAVRLIYFHYTIFSALQMAWKCLWE